MKKNVLGIMLSLTLLFLLVGCSKPKANEKHTEQAKNSSEAFKEPKTNNTESKVKEKEYAYTDIPNDFMARIESIENGTKAIPKREILPFANAGGLDAYRMTRLYEWTEYFPKTLMLVLTVDGCKRCDDYEEMLVQKVFEEKEFIEEEIEAENDKVSLARYELPNDSAKIKEELLNISETLDVDPSLFDESRPIVLSFVYFKENDAKNYKWKNIYRAVPKEDGSGLSDSVKGDYLNRISNLYNETFKSL